MLLLLLLEFDLFPPAAVNPEECSYASGPSPTSTSEGTSDSASTVFVDETMIDRWGVPEGPNSLFAQITALNQQKRQFSEMSDGGDAATEPLTISNYRRQKEEWIQKAAQEKTSCKKRLL